MSMAPELVSEALALPEADRAHLASELIGSLEYPKETDPDLEVKQIETLRRRTREFKEGKVVCRSADQVYQRIQAKLDGNHFPSWGKSRIGKSIQTAQKNLFPCRENG